jgi:hypothetical protein
MTGYEFARGRTVSVRYVIVVCVCGMGSKNGQMAETLYYMTIAIPQLCLTILRVSDPMDMTQVLGQGV